MSTQHPIPWPPAGRADEIRDLYVRYMDTEDLQRAIDRGEPITAAHLVQAMDVREDPDQVAQLRDELERMEERADDADSGRDSAEDDRNAAHDLIKDAIRDLRAIKEAHKESRQDRDRADQSGVPTVGEQIAELLKTLEAFAKANRI
jgi:hypothetical protein